jgi:hypothetical protein
LNCKHRLKQVKAVKSSCGNHCPITVREDLFRQLGNSKLTFATAPQQFHFWGFEIRETQSISM